MFNTTCLIGPDGILSRYRKVNPWLPWEVHASPHDLAGYDEPLFPVVETEIGRLGAAICYDWLFPEAIRALALGGAEVLIRVSAYMDPWGATPPLDWWTLFNRTRAVENFAFVVAANQGASAEHYPPFSWPGGSMIVDFDGRILAQADPGPGEKIVVGPIDLAALRAERQDAAAIISFPTCAPKPILNFTLGPSFARSNAVNVKAVRPPARSPTLRSFYVDYFVPASAEIAVYPQLIIPLEHDDATTTSRSPPTCCSPWRLGSCPFRHASRKNPSRQRFRCVPPATRFLSRQPSREPLKNEIPPAELHGRDGGALQGAGLHGTV